MQQPLPPAALSTDAADSGASRKPATVGTVPRSAQAPAVGPTGRAGAPLTGWIETPRLHMRYLRADDAAELTPILSDMAVTRYLSYRTWACPEDGRAWCDEFAEANQNGATAWFVCIEKASGRMIGNCVLFDHVANCNRAELGYMLGRAWWGKGFAHEAVTALIDHGFQMCGLRRLEVQIHVDNAASHRLATRLGFQREGVLRQRLLNCDNVPHDVVMYGLLRSDKS